jgi:hypothetical protein
MPYGTIKIDTITFTSGSSDVSIPVSGLVQNPTFTGNVTVTGTVTASNVVGTTLISGLTVTGTTANFTSGNFSNISGGTHTITSGVFASGTAANPSISFVSDPNTGIYSPGADQVAISTNGTQRLLIDSNGKISSKRNRSNTSGQVGLEIAPGDTTVAYGFRVDSANNSLFLDRVDNASTFLAVTATGQLGLGTSSPSVALEIGTATGAAQVDANVLRVNRGVTGQYATFSSASGAATINGVNGSGGAIYFQGDGNTRAVIDSSGRVGIGTTSPGALLHAAGKIRFGSNASYYGEIDHDAASTGSNIYNHSDSGGHIFQNGGTERLRIDSSGRLLVGTSTARANFFNTTQSANIQLEGTSGTALMSLVSNANDTGGNATLIIGKTRGTTVGSTTVVQSGDVLGRITFQGSDGTEFVQAADIYAEVDGTPGANDMPGRLVFSTTADGASSPTERMRITNSGEIWVGTTVVQRYNNITTALWGYDPASTGTMVFINVGTAGDGAYTGVALGKAATSWSTYSDERGKTALVSIEDGLSKIGTLRAVTGRYIEEEEGVSRSFLIAQDVQAVLPEAVDAGNPEKLNLRYTEVIPLLVAALKESKERIEALEQRLTEAGIA